MESTAAGSNRHYGHDEDGQKPPPNTKASASSKFRKSVLSSILQSQRNDDVVNQDPSQPLITRGIQRSRSCPTEKQTHSRFSNLFPSSPIAAVTDAASHLFGSASKQQQLQQQQQRIPLIRRRSSLFADLQSSKSSKRSSIKRRLSLSELSSETTNTNIVMSQTETNMNENDDNNNNNNNNNTTNNNHRHPMEMNSTTNTTTNSKMYHNKKPTAAAAASSLTSSSLFGAVMRNFGASSSASTLSSTKKTTATSTTASASTPTSNTPSTPQIAKTPDRSSQQVGHPLPEQNHSLTSSNEQQKRSLLFSPNGNTIMNMVNQFVMNSPFRFQSPPKKRTRWNETTTTTMTATTMMTDPESSKTIPSQTSPSATLQTITTTTTTPTTSTTMTLLHTPSPKKRKRRLDMNQGQDDDALKIMNEKNNDRGHHHDDDDDDDDDNDNNDDDNWMEASLTTDDYQIQHFVTDWSLKQQIQIEIHPNPRNITSWNSLTATSQWQSALTYWHYATPAAPPLIVFGGGGGEGGAADTSVPTSFSAPPKVRKKLVKTLSEDSTTSRTLAPINSSGKQGLSSLLPTEGEPITDSRLASQIIQAVKLMAKSKNSAGNGPGRSSSTMLESTRYQQQLQQQQQQKREWQQALESVYFNWCRAMEGTDRDALPANQCYFYCHSKDHVVLFRVEEENVGSQMTRTPIVLLSGLSSPLCQQLRDFGIETLDVSEKEQQQPSSRTKSDQGILNTPQRTVRKQSPSSSGTSPGMLSPAVKADLEALRRAQAFGETAGADVSVKLNTKKSTRKPPPKPEPRHTLLVRGIDGVAMVFEWYLNTEGATKSTTFLGGMPQPVTNDPTAVVVLPTIFCRRVGPFLHSSMKCLTVTPVRQPASQEVKATTATTTTTTTINDSTMALQIDGAPIILPCAIQELIPLMVHTMMKLQKQQQQQQQQKQKQKQQAIHKQPHTTNASTTVDETTYAATTQTHPYMILQFIGEEDRQQSISKSSSSSSSSSLLGVGNRNRNRTHGTVWFNQGHPIPNTTATDDHHNGHHHHHHHHQEDRFSHRELPSGKSLQLVVWDGTRKNTVTYKIES